jgi:outer membrane biosynthesis protein TonB
MSSVFILSLSSPFPPLLAHAFLMLHEDEISGYLNGTLRPVGSTNQSTSAPTQPTQPAQPAQPPTATNQTTPATNQTAPTTPAQPAAPVQPSQPAQPAEPAGPVQTFTRDRLRQLQQQTTNAAAPAPNAVAPAQPTQPGGQKQAACAEQQRMQKLSEVIHSYWNANGTLWEHAPKLTS